jgi:hypothetical protein
MSVTLRSLRAAHPALFAPEPWGDDAAFLDAPLEAPLPRLPAMVITLPQLPDDSWLLQSAVQLAELYVRTPTAAVWSRFLWTADVDRAGRRVYVGGVTPETGWQLQWHAPLTRQWGFPSWAP